MKKSVLASELSQSREYLLINTHQMETTTQVLIWTILLIVLLWMMPDRKVRLIFGEARKLVQILPLSKITEAIIRYFKSKQ